MPPQGVAVQSHSHRTGAEETRALGMQLGSGGKERVIGLQCAVLVPDWTGKCENEEDERGASGDPSAVYPLRSLQRHTHTLGTEM